MQSGPVSDSGPGPCSPGRLTNNRSIFGPLPGQDPAPHDERPPICTPSTSRTEYFEQTPFDRPHQDQHNPRLRDVSGAEQSGRLSRPWPVAGFVDTESPTSPELCPGAKGSLSIWKVEPHHPGHSVCRLVLVQMHPPDGNLLITSPAALPNAICGLTARTVWWDWLQPRPNCSRKGWRSISVPSAFEMSLTNLRHHGVLSVISKQHHLRNIVRRLHDLPSWITPRQVLHQMLLVHSLSPRLSKERAIPYDADRAILRGARQASGGFGGAW